MADMNELKAKRTYSEVKRMMNDLLGRIGDAIAGFDENGKKISRGNGYEEFRKYLRTVNVKAPSVQTLINYRNGTHSGQEYEIDNYHEKYTELKPLIDGFVKFEKSKNRFRSLTGTKWFVYFLNRESTDGRFNLGRATLMFSGTSDSPKATLKNIPGIDNPDKEGKCEVLDDVLILNLRGLTVHDSHLNIMLDISGDIENHTVLVGGYQSQEDNMITLGTLLLEKILENMDAVPLTLSITENKGIFLNTNRVIREFFANEFQNMIKILPNPSGTLESLHEKMRKNEIGTKARLLSHFLEPDCPRIFLSCPISFVDKQRQKNVEKHLIGLKSKLEERFNIETCKNKIVINYWNGPSNSSKDYLEVMEEIRRTSIFVFIYPHNEPVSSTSLVELGWALMAVKHIIAYSMPDALPGHLEDYLDEGDRGIYHKSTTLFDEAGFSVIFNKIVTTVEKLYNR